MIPFGHHLRACRLRWNRWNKRNCWIRITPKFDKQDNQFYVEVATRFSGLSQSVIKNDAKHYDLDPDGEDSEVVQQCEPLNYPYWPHDYQCWLVDDSGRVLTEIK